MRIHEVCQATGLTKKAINWYEEQGLIAIPTDENGYRDFQDADIQKLKEIGLLRSLGLSAKEIETVLRASDKPAALKTIQAQKQRALKPSNSRWNCWENCRRIIPPMPSSNCARNGTALPLVKNCKALFRGSLDGSYFNIFSLLAGTHPYRGTAKRLPNNPRLFGWVGTSDSSGHSYRRPPMGRSLRPVGL